VGTTTTTAPGTTPGATTTTGALDMTTTTTTTGEREGEGTPDTLTTGERAALACLANWGAGPLTLAAFAAILPNDHAAWRWAMRLEWDTNHRTTDAALRRLGMCPRRIVRAVAARTGTDDWTR
jgi:hypothetical protein